MNRFRNKTQTEKTNSIFCLFASISIVLTVVFGLGVCANDENAEQLSQIKQSSSIYIDNIKNKLDLITVLTPVDGIDSNVISMLQNLIDQKDNDLKISVVSSSSPQILKDGSILYGSSDTDMSIIINIVVVKDKSSFTKNISVVIPKKKVQPIFTEKAINAKDYGAKGNGTSDDTLAIQNAIDYISSVGGGTVNVDSGTYLINPDVSINMKSNIQLSLTGDAILKSLASGRVNSEIINIVNVNNVNVIGGKIIGDRYIHTGTGGEWGMGVNVAGSSNVNITGINITDCWGDGIYIGGVSSSNVVIYSVISNNNRRQGMSITNAKNIAVANSEFKNTNGTLPQAGIDIEPNINETVEDIKINNVKFINNQGSGIDILGMSGIVRRVDISNSTINSNSGIGIMMDRANDITLSNNAVINNLFGVEIKRDVYNVALSSMNISNNKSRGVSMVSNGQTKGIDNIAFLDSTISNNSQSSPGKADGIKVDNYDSAGYIRNIKFMNTKFIDNQSKHTQGYGLTVGGSKTISGITVYADCVFSGNINGNLYAAIPISQNVPR